MKKRIKAADIVSYIIVAVMCLIFLFPFVYIVSRSLMGDVESYSATGALFPEHITFEAYRTVLDADLLKYFKNTLIVLVTNCVGIPFSAALCAYGFSKIKFHGSDVVFSVVLATMMLPSIVIQIPLYAIYYNMKWLGTLLPLIVPGFFGGGAVNIFLMMQYMRGIPNDLLNAAKIDGANSFCIFVKIMIPLCMPIIIYVVVNTFLSVWNDFTGPLIFLRGKPDKYTLAVGIYFKFMGGLSQRNYPNQQMAVGVLMLIPPCILFFIFQKQLLEGVTMSGIKG